MSSAVDAESFQSGNLLLGRFFLFPLEHRLVVCKLEILDCGREQQGIDELRLLAALLGHFLHERLGALGEDVPLHPLLGGDKVNRAIAFLYSLVHAFGFLIGRGEQRGWAAQEVPAREPQEVEDQEILLARLRRQPHAPADHLDVQGAALGRAQHHDAVHSGAVPPLCKEHRVAEHLVAPCAEVGEHLRTVLAFAVDLGGGHATVAQHLRERLADLDQGQENDGSA